jgi:DNA-binding transcriptional MerR regulator
VLTISQLAATAGVTVRTVRHYHHVGLLPEPERDVSGYRRYSAQAAVDLIRIRTLADAGVPLARIDALLHAQPTEFASAVTDIDAELRRKIDQLTENRRRIAELASGERLVLPAEVVAILDRMRSLGVSELRVRLERDSWILMQALDPGQSRGASGKRTPASTTPRRRACISPAINQSTGIRTIHAWTSSSTTWTPGRSNTNETAAGRAT